MLDVCFTPTPLLLDDASGLGIFHDINGSPGIVGTVGNQLYVARLDGNEMNTSTAAIDVSIPPSIHVGDFAGDGVTRIVVRDDDTDSIYVLEGGMLVGAASVVPLTGANMWSPAAAMDRSDGASLLVSRAGVVGMVQAHRLESDTWVAVGEPLMAPDYLAWSFDANGDGLRDVGLSSFPAMASSTSPATPMKIALTRSLCILPVGLETGD